MAQWSDPRATGAPDLTRARDARDTSFDAGLRAHMLKVYNYMTSGVLLTGIVALLFAQTGMVYSLLNEQMTGPSGLGWIVALAPIGIALWMSFGFNRISAGTAQALFWAYAGLTGASLSIIFLVYTNSSIALTFFATAAAFGSLSLWGYTTKKDLSGWGSFLLMGVIGLIVAGIVNAFWMNDTFSLAVAGIGVLVFAGLTAYHTQMIKSLYADVAGTPLQSKMAIFGALQLYLDFINMFLYLLRFLGNRD